MMQTQISLPFISAGPTGPLHLELTLTRAKFDELTHDLVMRTEGPVRQALSDAGMSPNDIDQGFISWWFYSYCCCTRISKEITWKRT